LRKYREPLEHSAIKVLEDQTWDCIGHSDVALAASGTVTIETAILGTPMVTFYKVMPVSWFAGRHLVKVPFLSMVNLVAGRRIVPELIQHQMTPANLAAEVTRLLTNDGEVAQMRAELATVRAALSPRTDPFEQAAQAIASGLHQPQPATV
jgi:lipid-A-disaccharide synthase